MSLIIRLRRVRPEELDGVSVESLLAAVPLRSDETEFAAALAAATLFDLSDEWEVVHAALTGGSNDTRDVGYQPVLGGGMLGRTATEVLVALAPDEVHDVARHLGGVDPHRQVSDNLAAMEAAHGGEIGDKFARHLAGVLRGLSSFYAKAASDGDAVVKVVYS
ncbi:DUF1877 family protein [Streptomyces sp. NPDC060064]|uniref:DUF1877 family protein n=1 Tax=Streptomyces sp. NPDC060064 TaxID=3347049 RepID=UPI00368221B9